MLLYFDTSSSLDIQLFSAPQRSGEMSAIPWVGSEDTGSYYTSSWAIMVSGAS